MATRANTMYCSVAGFFGIEKPLAAMVAGSHQRTQIGQTSSCKVVTVTLRLSLLFVRSTSETKFRDTRLGEKPLRGNLDRLAKRPRRGNDTQKTGKRRRKKRRLWSARTCRRSQTRLRSRTREAGG